MLAEANPLVDLATHNGPFAGLLLLILWGGFKEKPWWVFGWMYSDLLDRYNERGERLDQLYDQSRAAVTAAERATQIAQASTPAPPVDRPEGTSV
jgi:hypothetical protein